ncbi:MAG TPA: hypothetical protein VN838_03045, partial [Bradyrhizobium sp.]|nr:hypothetical protein [Bradyrhizobium sp.]
TTGLFIEYCPFSRQRFWRGPTNTLSYGQAGRSTVTAVGDHALQPIPDQYAALNQHEAAISAIFAADTGPRTKYAYGCKSF